MKTSVVSALIVILAAAGAAAETHIRQVFAVDPFYDGTPQGGTETVLDVWIGPASIAILSEDNRIVYDRAAGLLTIVSMRDSTFCEIALPVIRDSVLAPDYKARLDRWFYDGDVTRGSETRRIAGRSCVSYGGTQWIQLGEEKYSEADKTYWLASDLPFDWRLHRELQDAILALANNSDGFREAVKRYEGFALEGETVVYDRGNRITTRLTTSVLEEGTPPAGYCGVPAYCRKLDRLPRGHFLALIQVVY